MSARILLVEDHIDIREITTILLVNSGFQVVSACNGLEALNFFNQQSFDLIITDIRMPVMDGNQFIQELEKVNEFSPLPPLIALSYNPFDIHASPIITRTALKPMLLKHLQATIMEALDYPTPARLKQVYQ